MTGYCTGFVAGLRAGGLHRRDNAAILLARPSRVVTHTFLGAFWSGRRWADSGGDNNEAREGITLLCSVPRADLFCVDGSQRELCDQLLMRARAG